MGLFAAITLIGVGFTILVLGGESLVKASVSIAARLKVNPAIIGLTIIAGGTSAPEIATSFMAALEGAHNIAMGNIVGSNLFNILAILGMSSLVKVSVVDKKLLDMDLFALILFTLVFVAVIYNQHVAVWEGGAFLLLLVFFFTRTIQRSRRCPENYQEAENLEKLKSPVHDMAYLLVGFAALVGGAHLALKGSIQLGQIIGLSERVIGLTIVSVGTGLPELATSFVANWRGRNELAIANVIGSNIINTLGVPALAIIPGPIIVEKSLAHRDAYFLIAVTLLLFVVLRYNKGFLGRRSGLLFISIYLAYLYWLI